MPHESDKGPAVKIPPPLIFVVFILLALVGEYMWPTSLIVQGGVLYVGWGLCGFAFVLAITAAIQFLNAKTHIEPWRPAQSLILSGLFRYSRNPIYLAFILFTIGLGVSLNSLWVMLSTIPATFVLQRFVILKEERYLTAKFGKHYLEYCARVRRWL